MGYTVLKYTHAHIDTVITYVLYTLLTMHCYTDERQYSTCTIYMWYTFYRLRYVYVIKCYIVWVTGGYHALLCNIYTQ